MTQKLYILTESIDEGVSRMWYFQAASREAMAAQIIAHLDHFAEMFEGINWYSGLGDWRKRGPYTPEALLEAINKSSIDGDSESGFQIHLLDLTQPYGEAEDVTWSEEA